MEALLELLFKSIKYELLGAGEGGCLVSKLSKPMYGFSPSKDISSADL